MKPRITAHQIAGKVLAEWDGAEPEPEPEPQGPIVPVTPVNCIALSNVQVDPFMYQTANWFWFPPSNNWLRIHNCWGSTTSTQSFQWRPAFHSPPAMGGVSGGDEG